MNDPRQLALDLPTRPALAREDFFVAEANRLALAQVDRWPRWPGGRLAVSGPAGAGKTHLTRVWAVRSGAIVLPAAALAGVTPDAVAPDGAFAVEDVDALAALGPGGACIAEETLFHMANRLASGGGSLLVSGRSPPAFWRLVLPDLASRLAAAPVAALHPPDDALLAAVLAKLFADRGIGVGPGLVRFLLARMERSFGAAADMVATLDRAGLARGRAVTTRLAADVLAAQAGA